MPANSRGTNADDEDDDGEKEDLEATAVAAAADEDDDREAPAEEALPGALCADPAFAFTSIDRFGEDVVIAAPATTFEVVLLEEEEVAFDFTDFTTPAAATAASNSAS